MATSGAQNGALSSVELQSHYDEVAAQMPVLQLSILPRSLANSLAAQSTDPGLTRLAKKAAAGLTECQICSCSSQPEQLQLQLSNKLEFHSRAVHITAVRLVCAQCAAVSSCSTLIQLLTPPVGVEADHQRSEQLQQLLLHFAAVNNAAPSITSNPDSLALWVQELACRAYSLQVVANSLKGWQLQPAGASTQQILTQLLSSKKKRKSEVVVAAPTAAAAAAAAEGGKAKKKAKSKEGQQLQQQQQHAAAPAAAGKGSKRLSSAAAAAVQQAGVAPSSHSKKHKKSHAGTSQAAAEQKPKPATKQQQQQHGSLKSPKRSTQQTGNGVIPEAKSGKGSKHAAAEAGQLRTPQHSKIKSSSSTKQKLLKSAPR